MLSRTTRTAVSAWASGTSHRHSAQSWKAASASQAWRRVSTPDRHPRATLVCNSRTSSTKTAVRVCRHPGNGRWQCLQDVLLNLNRLWRRWQLLRAFESVKRAEKLHFEAVVIEISEMNLELTQFVVYFFSFPNLKDK